MISPISSLDLVTCYSFTDKTAIVTGGGTGIGQATAWALLAAGAKAVIITGRRVDKLEQTAKAAEEFAYPGAIITCQADITEKSGREKVVAAALSLGTLDLIVNNAGAFAYQALADTDDQTFDNLFAVNVKAPFILMRDLLPLIQKAKGSIVNVSSSLADKPISNTAAYNGTKAALIQITRTLALELGPSGVRVNAVLPAVVATPMYRDRFDNETAYQETLDNMAREHPLRRVGTPYDIAKAILFLASPAASWVTGVALPIDGGMLCT